jgi:ABC-2 type transport system permease protein
MKAHRLLAVVLRQLYATRRSLDRLTDIFYWPAIDLAIWGLTSSYFQKLSGGQDHIVVTILTGLVLWIILYMASNSIAITILADLWDRNLMNVLVSPLSWTEWMAGNILLSLIKVILSFIFTLLLTLLLYKISLFSTMGLLIPHIALLIMTSWWIAFIIIGSILRFGTRIQTLAWALVAVISPFSAIYYPLSSLPKFAQYISYVIPSSYIFESAREVIAAGHYDTFKLGMCLGLNIIYLILSLIYLKTSIDTARTKGLASLY